MGVAGLIGMLRRFILIVTTNRFYEPTMGFLALICVINLIIQTRYPDHFHLLWIDQVIWILFLFDYFGRLWVTKRKWKFIKNHIIELISIIPFSMWFQSARILQIIRFLRALVALQRAMKHFKHSFAQQGFITILAVTVIVVSLIGLAVYEIEPSTFKDDWQNAVWWAMVTATTTGYGDYSPVSTFGRILAAIMMLFGTGLIGILSGIMASYYVNRRTDEVTDPYKYLMMRQIQELENLNPEQREQLIAMIRVYIKPKVDQAEKDDD